MAKSSGKKQKNQQHVKPAPGKKKIISQITSKSPFVHWGPMALLVISAIIVLQTRLKLLAIPMERDEAGFAYIGHWLLKDKSLYVDMVDNKLPGLYMLYGVFTTLFGYHSDGVHLGLLLANAVSAICFYLLLRDLFNRFVAALATAFFLVLVTSANVVGFAAHATQLLLPFVMGGWLLFWHGIRSGRNSLFFLAGLLLGFGFIVKQQSIVFGMMAALLWWPLRMRWSRNGLKRLPYMEWVFLGLGGLLPVAVTIGYFFMKGRMDDLYFWAFTQPAGMAATFKATRWELFFSVFPQIIEGFIPVWIAAACGLILVWLSGFKKEAALFGTLFFTLGLLSVVIGAAFYNHYFILALPGVALLAAVTLYWVVLQTGHAGNIIGLCTAFILLIWPVISQREYFFSPEYDKIHRKAYNQNMFPELEKIGHELSKRVPEGGRIGILGSEPGVLVTADREGCSKHLFMYPLLSDPETSPEMQQEYLKEMKECLPEYMVWNSVTGSWSGGYEKLQMFKQLMQWTEQNYVTTGIAEFRPDAPGILVWDEALPTHQSQSEYKVYVFKRK